ncbi:hypothetical protein KEM56_005022, partial [Ascosphaera pollenicola]
MQFSNMDQDNRMVTSDVDHGDNDDDIEIDIDMPEGQGDAMVDDVSITSQQLEDADMMDGDDQYMDEEINDEPMEYYEEDVDAAIEDAPEEHEELPEEEMTPADDLLEQPLQHQDVQEAVVQEAVMQHPSQPSVEVAQPTLGQTTAVEPSISAIANDGSLEQAPVIKTAAAPDLAEKPLQNIEEQGTTVPDTDHSGGQAANDSEPVDIPSHETAPAPVPKEDHEEQETGDEDSEENLHAGAEPVEPAAEEDKGDGKNAADGNLNTNLPEISDSHHDDAEQSGREQEAEAQEAEDHQEDNAIVDASLALHSVKVMYQENEIYLFPPPESDASDTFFLHDESLAGQSMSNLLKACRGVLGEHITPEEDLHLDIDRLGLSFTDNPSQPYSMSLYQIVDVYLRLCANDEDNVPGPMYITLHSRLNANAEFANLVEAAQSGKGLSYFERYGEGVDDPESEETTVEREEEQYFEQEEEQGEGGDAKEQQVPHDVQVHDDDKEETHQGNWDEHEAAQEEEGGAEEEGDPQDALPTIEPELPQQAPVQNVSHHDTEQVAPASAAEADGKQYAESEFGSTVDTFEHEESQKLVSDLGNQTIAEYEGAEYDSRHTEAQDLGDDHLDGSQTLPVTGPADQSAADGGDQGAASHENHIPLEIGDGEPDVTEAPHLEPVPQGQDPAPPTIHTEGLDTVNRGADANAENYEDVPHAYEAEEYGENDDENDGLTTGQRIEARESDEEAQIGEYNDECKEADSDNELEEPLE